jgi:hypothetical protein
MFSERFITILIYRIISESIKSIIKEDMSLAHNGHTYDDYLDDGDFLEITKRAYDEFVSKQVSIEDFTDEEYRDKLLDLVYDMINHFISYEAVNNFGYKYGGFSYIGMMNVAEHIVDFLEEKVREK